MSFVSFEFLTLFAVVVPLYFALPVRAANLVLLLASYIFYAYWEPRYLGLLLFTTVCDYRIALWIDGSQSEKVRRALLIGSLLLNFGILALFKYSSMFAAVDLPLVLPIGISFYTFQEVSYVVDVYRRHIAAADRFTSISLFISFFPQLVAGPIERASNILPQFVRQHCFSEEDAVAGLRLILLGFFKKLVIADRLAAYVNQVYGNPTAHDSTTLALATFFFACQIYADFSAYSQIAIGTARVLGFRLMTNFRQPYLSSSVSEFWRRWHISLSTWFRDYVYVPLGGNRVSFARRNVNVMVVFLLSGLWHGAHVKFVLWGALHGLAVVLETMWRRAGAFGAGGARGVFGQAAAVVATGVFVCLAWVPFRAASLGDTWYIWQNLVPKPTTLAAIVAPAGGARTFAGMALAIGVLLALDVLESRDRLWPTLARSTRPRRWALYYAVSFGILWFGVWGQYDFIYFQF